MKGKEKCKALKEIRRQIAEENDIPYVVSQCTHQGDCRGTCPKCESELRYLERELAVRQGLGKAVAVVGISASVCAGLTACGPVDMFKDALGIETQTAGDIQPIPGDPGDWEGSIQQAPEDLESDPQVLEDAEQPRSGEETGEESDYEGRMDVADPYEEETGMDETEEDGESKETEEMIEGEILPAEEQSEETISELAGDIPLPENSEETAP